MKYDVIIAGASFAGLTLASRLKGNILLIDRNEIGSHQTSACATEVKVITQIKCEESIIQSFKKVALHTHNKIYDIDLPSDYCTIDFQKFSQILNAQNSATFLQATINGLEDNNVTTSEGNFSADIIIDATGSKAVLATSKMTNYTNPDMISSGIETEIESKEDDRLRFFADERRRQNNVAWIFPAGKKTRYGVASYQKDPALLKKLKTFVEEENGLKMDKVHGGYFSYGFKKPIVDDLFILGDAAGQTLPLTGEGIRRIIRISIYLGDLIQKIIEKKISKTDAMKNYENYISKSKKQYEHLLKTQSQLPRYKNWHLNLIGKLLSYKPFFKYIWEKYEKI